MSTSARSERLEIEWTDERRGFVVESARRTPFVAIERAGRVWIRIDGRTHCVDPAGSGADAHALTGGERADPRLRSPMPGLVSRVSVAAGDSVACGAALLVVEAMKMEHEVRAPVDAVVVRVHVAAGDRVDRGELVVELEPR